jgi:hypothetical protein
MDSWHVVELADSGLHVMFPEMDEIHKVRCAGITAQALGGMLRTFPHHESQYVFVRFV